ncbi:MAG: tetratricopeptide repeat protein [Candidatus Symbiothrix sp.]|nr:tetratricopeptide repeat protein [Candidatus Symbiothrix sp.]
MVKVVSDIRAYNKAVKKTVGQWKIMYSLLVFLAIVSRFSPAFATLPAPLSLEEQRKFDYFFLDALRLKHKGEHTHAFNSLQYALKIDSTSSAALYEISQYYLYLKADDKALDALQRAVRYSPDNTEYKRTLADLFRDRGNNTEAITLYEELTKENPQNLEWHYYLSNLYMQQNQMDKAIQSLNGLENNMGVNEAVSLQKYQLYKSIKKRNEALKEIELLAQKFPQEAKYQILIGDFYLEANHPDKALIYYEKAAHINPDDPYYFIAMSNYYEAKGESESSAQEIEKALKNPSLDIEMKLGILGRYIEGLKTNPQDQNRANTLFETLMLQHSQDKELNGMYGQFLLSQGKIEEAKFQFQVVTEALPEDLTAWTKLLQIVVSEENTDEIIAVCEKALLYFPDVAEFYFYEGSAYYLKKEYPTALSIFQKGLEMTPPDNRGLLSTLSGQIGDLQHQLNNKQQAYEYYDKALQYNDKNIVVLNNYAYFLSLDKTDLDKAERMAATAVQLQPNSSTYIDTYAWVFFQKENYSLAKFYIESALAKTKQPSAELLEHYGDILYKTGNTDKAVAEWTKALLLLEEDEEDTTLINRKINDRTYYE